MLARGLHQEVLPAYKDSAYDLVFGQGRLAEEKGWDSSLKMTPKPKAVADIEQSIGPFAPPAAHSQVKEARFMSSLWAASRSSPNSSTSSPRSRARPP